MEGGSWRRRIKRRKLTVGGLLRGREVERKVLGIMVTWTFPRRESGFQVLLLLVAFPFPQNLKFSSAPSDSSTCRQGCSRGFLEPL